MQRLPHIACVLIYAIVGRHISSVDCNVGLETEDIEASDGNKNVTEIALMLLRSVIKAYQAIHRTVHTNKGEELLFLSVQKDLLHVNTSNFKREKVVMLDDSFIVDTDYDAGDGYLYWRTHDGRLQRAKRDGTGRETILSNIGAGGIAIDWVARNIYWTNEDNGTISVTSLDGNYTKTLISGLNGPRMLAVDPGAGRLYWSEWRSNPRIARASLDGSNIEKNFVDDDIEWPNGIALDYEKRLVYFADAKLDRIEVIGMDGSGRKIFLNESTPHVFGLSFLGGYLYWTDWRSESAERVKVDDVSNREVIMISSKRMMAITAKYANPLTMLTSNPCGTGNFQCSHFCFYTGQDAVCGCPDNPQEGTNDSCVE